jgi:hypothetical protein
MLVRLLQVGLAEAVAVELSEDILLDVMAVAEAQVLAVAVMAAEVAARAVEMVIPT